jgi:galactose mutarotase-like enzyme
LQYDYFRVDALVFPSLKSRAVTLRSTLHNRTVRVEYPGHDVLMLWSKPDAGYICIEPWLNAPDYTDHDGLIEHKPGCVRLAPGEDRIHTHTIAIG